MKKGWTYKKLGEVCDVISGQSPEGKYYNTEGKGTPFYQGKKDFTLKYVGEPTMWTYEVTKIAEKDDILMSVRAPVGDVNFATQRLCIGRGLAAIRTKGAVDKEFLFYFLVANKNRIKGKQGVGFASINRKEIMDINLKYPNNLSEQQRIVSRLDAAFAHIDDLKANAEKQLAEARNLFQKAKDKALNNPTWEKYTLNDICIQITDGTHRTPQYTTDGIPFLSVKNVTSGYIDMVNTRYISKEEHLEFLKRCKPEYGDLLYTKVGTTGIAKVIDINNEFSIFVSLALLKIKDDIVYNYFLEYVLNSPYVYKQSQKLTSGAANKNFLLTDIKKVELYLPPLYEQQRIVERLDALNAHVKELEEVLNKTITECDALKQALLRKVFE